MRYTSMIRCITCSTLLLLMTSSDVLSQWTCRTTSVCRGFGNILVNDPRVNPPNEDFDYLNFDWPGGSNGTTFQARGKLVVDAGSRVIAYQSSRTACRVKPYADSRGFGDVSVIRGNWGNVSPNQLAQLNGLGTHTVATYDQPNPTVHNTRWRMITSGETASSLLSGHLDMRIDQDQVKADYANWPGHGKKWKVTFKEGVGGWTLRGYYSSMNQSGNPASGNWSNQQLFARSNGINAETRGIERTGRFKWDVLVGTY